MAAKRKLAAGAAVSDAKKSKSDVSDHALAKSILAKCKDGHSELDFPDDAAVRKAFVDIANYVQDLENEVKELKQAKAEIVVANPVKTKEQIEAEASIMADKLVRGIIRQLTWKPSCKTNSAKFVYDGICPDPLVFGAMFNLDGPPKFKMKRMPGKEFEKIFGRIVGSVRYNDLYISKTDVIVRYNPDFGEFKISGSYGISSY